MPKHTGDSEVARHVFHHECSREWDKKKLMSSNEKYYVATLWRIVFTE